MEYDTLLNQLNSDFGFLKNILINFFTENFHFTASNFLDMNKIVWLNAEIFLKQLRKSVWITNSFVSYS